MSSATFWAMLWFLTFCFYVFNLIATYHCT